MIAIYARKNSFSAKWIEYCKSKNIEYITVDIYDTCIIDFLKKHNVHALFVHLDLYDYKIKLISRELLLSIEKSGINIFPNYTTVWHYDDKISQKYLFEALNIPHSPTHVFYEKDEAFKWLSKASFPLVFKLRGGAGSSNVVLLKNLKDANHYVNIMFTKGMEPVRSAFFDFKNKLKRHSIKRDWVETLKRLPVTIQNIMSINSKVPREKGYFLVQDFLPDNSFDTRVTIIGNKAFAFRRYNRTNDFRASGSGNIDYTIEEIDKRAIILAFESAKKIGSQSMAFDIIFDQKSMPVVLEICYVYASEAIHNAGGYWDSSLVFHNVPIWPEDAIIELVLGLNN